MITEREGDTIIVYNIYKESKSIYENKQVFTYYKLAYGIKNILKKSSTGINKLLMKIKKASFNQLTIFHDCNITG